MNIGIVPVTNPAQGGIYQYSQTMLDALKSDVLPGSPDQYILFVKDIASPRVETWHSAGWVVQPLYPPGGVLGLQLKIQQLSGVDLYNKAWRVSQQITHGAWIDRVRKQPQVSRWLKKFQVDLMVYPAPDELAFEIGLPFVMAIHDLQHRLQPHFPEMSANGNLFWREYLFRNAARNATLLISESEVGKQDILGYYGEYGISSERVKVLPFLPAVSGAGKVSLEEIQRVRSAYNLPERYLFYPAQFWPHKNHARIVQALNQLNNEQHVKIPVVFVGTYTGRQRQSQFRTAASFDPRPRHGSPGLVPRLCS